MKLCLLLLLALFGLNSCVSEYEERLDSAKVLLKEMRFIEEMEDIQNRDYSAEKHEIEVEINHYALISGNEERFMLELQNSVIESQPSDPKIALQN